MIRCTACRWRGSHTRARTRDLEGKNNVLVCPKCDLDRLSLRQSVIKNVASTNRPTSLSAQYIGWVKRRDSREMSNGGVVWVFTDGSSTGSCAAVVLDGDKLEEHVRHAPKPPTWNVGAELGGVLLGVRHAPRGRSVVVVADYIGSAGYLTGRWRIRDLDTLRRVVVIASLIESRGLVVSFVHHKGHQRDPSDFTRWNTRADELCGQRPKEKKA